VTLDEWDTTPPVWAQRVAAFLKGRTQDAKAAAAAAAAHYARCEQVFGATPPDDLRTRLAWCVEVAARVLDRTPLPFLDGAEHADLYRGAAAAVAAIAVGQADPAALARGERPSVAFPDVEPLTVRSRLLRTHDGLAGVVATTADLAPAEAVARIRRALVLARWWALHGP